MPSAQEDLLLSLAKKYVWWKAADKEVEDLPHLVAQVFTFGTWNDAFRMYSYLGEPICKDVIAQVPPGIFNQRSWEFWHNYLGIEPTPPLPKRNLPD